MAQQLKFPYCLGLKQSVFVALMVLSTGAFAGLGETETAIAKDQSVMAARTLVKENHSVYTVHSWTEGNESAPVTVKEYVDSQGNVFAVSWSGSHHPNLRTLLGKYADEHAQAQQQRAAAGASKGQRRISTIRSANIIVERTGVGRLYAGKAYIPNKIPDGVTLDEIK